MCSVEESLQKLIKEIATEQNFKNFNINITPVPLKGANYSSILYKVKITDNEQHLDKVKITDNERYVDKVKITDDERHLDLFAKIASLNEDMRSQLAFDVFSNERFIYMNLIKIYKRLETIHKVAEKDRCKFPVFYGSSEILQQETIVLEDLTVTGFGTADRFQSVDWSYASAALSELAKFHALSLAFQHHYPEEFDQVTANIPSKTWILENENNEKWFKNSKALFLESVQEDNKKRVEVFLEKLNVTVFNNIFKSSKCNVIIHADYKPTNLLHRLMSFDTAEVIAVDYQIVQVGSPIIDILYFIFLATDGAFRAEYYQQMVDHYRKELVMALMRFNINLESAFSNEDFKEELAEKLPFGLMAAVIYMSILTVSEDEAPVLNSMSSFNDLVVNPGDLFARRVNDIVDDFIRFGVV